MAKFVKLQQTDPHNPNSRATVLLNLDAVIYFAKVSDNLCFAVTQPFDTDSIGFAFARTNNPVWLHLPYSLDDLERLIAEK